MDVDARREPGEVTGERSTDPYDVRRGERGESIRLAFSEFLAVALLVVLALVLVGAGIYTLDRTRPNALGPVREFLAANFFRTSEATSNVLQTIAATVITVASITFSLLLVAIQQSASSFTTQVFDQFLRRRLNQFYFGFFVGLGMYALLQLAAVNPAFNPVYGATAAVLMSALAVGLLLVLVYTSVNQMRPVVILESMHDHLIEARARQLRHLVARTRATPRRESLACTVVRSERTGFVLRIDVDRIQRAIASTGRDAEVVLLVSIGTFMAYGDRLAFVHVDDREAARVISRAVEAAVRRERQRTIDSVDPAYGLQQLENVGWTSISTAQQNPAAARLVVTSLRDVLARLIAVPTAERGHVDADVVYYDDVPDVLMQTVESLAVVTAESQQHQIAADLIMMLATLLERLPDEYRERAIDVLLRTLPALASHPPTLVLERSLTSLADALDRTEADEAAALARKAVEDIRQRIGRVEAEYTPR